MHVYIPHIMMTPWQFVLMLGEMPLIHDWINALIFRKEFTTRRAEIQEKVLHPQAGTMHRRMQGMDARKGMQGCNAMNAMKCNETNARKE